MSKQKINKYIKNNLTPNSTYPQALLVQRGLCNLSSPGRWSPVRTEMGSQWSKYPKVFMLKISNNGRGKNSNNRNICPCLEKGRRLALLLGLLVLLSPCLAVGKPVGRDDGLRARCGLFSASETAPRNSSHLFGKTLFSSPFPTKPRSAVNQANLVDSLLIL